MFTFWPISKQTVDVQKNVEGIEWLAIAVLRFAYSGFWNNSGDGIRVLCGHFLKLNKILSGIIVLEVSSSFSFKSAVWNNSAVILLDQKYVCTCTM